MKRNRVLDVDSYKASHWLQYPEGTEYVSSYIESRGGKYDYTLFFGLQMYLKEYLSKPITLEEIQEAEEFFEVHGEPFNKDGWIGILNKLGGYLPLEIQAVPEGMLLPTRNALVRVINTDKEFFWSDSYIETALLRAVWYPTTVATQSHFIKQIIKRYLEETGDIAGLNFKLHDFGARGVSSFESAAIGGAAHLVNFMGSDTISGVLALSKYYNAPVSGFSIPAAEHSTTTILGREGEEKQFKRMLDQFAKPGSLLAVVSDGYDIYNACENIWGEKLRQQVIESGATVVIRPDSGIPEEVVVDIMKILARKFGYQTNDKGYNVLNNVRVIQGDGINEVSVEKILANSKKANFSADNIAFGMGGALLQQINRDTQKFAMKASWAQIKGEGVDVYKDPVTDPGKTSKKGFLTTVTNEIGEIKTIREEDFSDEFHSRLMRPVWRNGELLVDEDLQTIRNRTW